MMRHNEFSEGRGREDDQFRVHHIALSNENLPLSAQTAEELGIFGLHCGSGSNLKTGCLNTDRCVLMDKHGRRSRPGAVAAVSGEYYYLEHDATERFPIEDECFEWVYSEHFIEHLSLLQGIRFLAEMRRILKPGGFVRLSTEGGGAIEKISKASVWPTHAAGRLATTWTRGRRWTRHGANLAAWWGQERARCGEPAMSFDGDAEKVAEAISELEMPWPNIDQPTNPDALRLWQPST